MPSLTRTLTIHRMTDLNNKVVLTCKSKDRKVFEQYTIFKATDAGKAMLAKAEIGRDIIVRLEIQQ